MNFLIDGHNLIGRMSDIDLSDPDDEAKLVLRLLNWVALGDKRRVIVVFDGGVPGQQWHHFRSDRVKTVFVPRGKPADAWLIRFMQKQVRNPQEFTLVTNDQAIVRVARRRRIEVQSSDQFAEAMDEEKRRLLQGEHAGNQADEEATEEAEGPKLSGSEVDAWLEMFGGNQQVSSRPYRPRPKPKREPAEAPAETSDPARPLSTPADRDDVQLTPDEVAEWLRLFDAVAPARPAGPTVEQARKSVDESVSRRKSHPKAPSDSALTQEDVDLWYSLYGEKDDQA